MLEREELFARQVGEDTDIVAKELYRFADRDGTQLCLRPEATVPTLRARAAAGNLGAGTVRVWYFGAMFRRERPQRGRYRQFHQFGAEAVGSLSPLLDAEIIMLCARIWRELGVADKLELQVNNLGSADERAAYRKLLQQHLRTRTDDLDEAARARLETNPLRILDSKDEDTLAALADAPEMAEVLGPASRKHVDDVVAMIEDCGVKAIWNPRLVRGLDYYGLTVFEWALPGDERRQSAVAGGGRYDSLAAQIGAADAPGVGFAAGVERLLELADLAVEEQADAYLAVADGAIEPADALRLCESLRNAGLSVIEDLKGGKMKALFRRADQSKASLAVVIGTREAAAKAATIKHLRCSLDQREVGQGDLPAAVKEMLSSGAAATNR